MFDRAFFHDKVDVVLDTDAFNEIDDQFAIAYLLSYKERLNTVAFYAAPFFNSNSTSPADGMEKSYREIERMLSITGESVPVFKGADRYLVDESTPIDSPASRDLADRAMQYSCESPLYVVAIGAITNVASALLMAPQIAKRIVVVWLGGHAHHYRDTAEFNMRQDVFAARAVMSGTVPFVQLPCNGVVSAFTISGPELERYLVGKNPVAHYLASNTVAAAERYAEGSAWTRCLWDVTAVAWLVNDGERFMLSRPERCMIPTLENVYEASPTSRDIEYVYHVKRDALMTDLMTRLAKEDRV